MSEYICIDTSVFIKLFFEEEDSFKAKVLMQKVIEDNQIIVLPSFAWAEMGSIFRKKIRTKQVNLQDASEMWNSFTSFPGIEYVNEVSIMDRAWKISCYYDLPTLYDAAFLAVVEEIRDRTGQSCEFWTADERLINSLQGKKEYVSFLNEL
ncbi:Predicted nucleic acid-binding protein, contains PIN domain [Desulfotomaculum arcticum]|uniref:Predicted nucleic acid-binding protein, contains PIN domain n=1 Tax=Desulfotruncus arcticus DSM 17038 TaxID=1121424 RepID=A0A1I2YQ50_9FIRM|nr:type II toxin-antitoxin system VapC family toxin [Desulfotruncus arcticus]SFH27782.1 Predicted nucleic acid-binding protein, contains PIN domain [Desulfotomaculum arcticum] [Desulfotruncus arcticus DSM 17038]